MATDIVVILCTAAPAEAASMAQALVEQRTPHASISFPCSRSTGGKADSATILNT